MPATASPNVPARTDAATPYRPKQSEHVFMLPPMFCAACGNQYRHTISKQPNGKVSKIRMDCDTCFHGKDLSGMMYVNATNSAEWAPPAIECPFPACGNPVIFDRSGGFRCKDGHKIEDAGILARVAGDDKAAVVMKYAPAKEGLHAS